MSFDYRFEPPTPSELAEMGYTDKCPYYFECFECCFDCDKGGDDAI